MLNTVTCGTKLNCEQGVFLPVNSFAKAVGSTLHLILDVNPLFAKVFDPCSQTHNPVLLHGFERIDRTEFLHMVEDPLALINLIHNYPFWARTRPQWPRTRTGD